MNTDFAKSVPRRVKSVAFVATVVPIQNDLK